MPGTEIIEESLQKLINYIESQNYRGYDPYDALKSPLFRLPVLRSNKLIRFGAQQLVKRCPLNLRPLLRIPKGYNPVTLGLCIQGYSYLARSSELRAQALPAEAKRRQGSESERTLYPHFPITPSPHLPLSPSQEAQGKESFAPSDHTHRLPNTEYRLPITYDECIKRIEFLINELKNLIPPGYHGACWGYDFPWEARYASIPSLQPTEVATGIITNALYIAYKTTGNNDCAELIKSSAHFVLNDLQRSYEGDKYIFSYSPFDNQQVFNASMKGVRIIAQAYSLTGDENLKSQARRAVQFVVSHQRSDGSWGYSLASEGGWTDNYHTGYILDCLHDYGLLTGDNEFDQNLKSGYDYYKTHFIEESGMPCFYSDKAYPGDCTSGAQTILTLVRFGDHELARKVALWIICNMQSANGSFYYRKYKNYTIKTNFMRWSDAWMFEALTGLMSLEMK
jgi:hypothetical protein